MKKSQAYVVKGEAAPLEEVRGELPPLPSWLQASSEGGVLPYDYGMRGRTGAYEVKSLAKAAAQSLEQLEEHLAQSSDPLLLASRALDQLLPPAERYKLTAEDFSHNILTLSLASRGDRFRMSRSIVPKLKTALKPTLGFVTIRLIER